MIERLLNKTGFVGVALVVTVAGLVSWGLGIGFLAALLISAFTFVANGLVATLEDDLPGGLNNPDGTTTPAYVRRLSRIGRGLGGLVTSIVAVGALTAGWRGALPFGFAVLFGMASTFLGLAIVVRSRAVRWTALLLVVVALVGAISRVRA